MHATWANESGAEDRGVWGRALLERKQWRGSHNETRKHIGSYYFRVNSLLSSLLSSTEALITFALGSGNFSFHVDNDSPQHTVLKGKCYFRGISLFPNVVLLQAIHTLPLPQGSFEMEQR